MKLVWVAVVLLVVVGVGAVAFVLIGPGGATAQATNFLTAAVQRATVVDQVAATGTLASKTTYELVFGQPPRATEASPDGGTGAGSTNATPGGGGSGTVSWPVMEVKVAAGAHVSKGELLATADTAAVDAQIVAAQAQLDAAETQRDTALTDVALYSARAQVAQDKQSLAELKAARKYASLTAPADGTVASIEIAAGLAAPSGPAITISSDSLVATAQVAEADVPRIAIGQAAIVTVTAVGATATGKVTSLASNGSSTGGGVVSFGVIITLADVPKGARPGMSAQVAVTIAEAEDVLAIPSVALEGSAGNYRTQVMGANGQPESRAISVGLITGDLVEVRDGLQLGDVVVTGTASALANQAQSGPAGLGGFGDGLGGFGRGRQARGN
jgi:macrolide-specific efflux system membrane fusion protein